MEQRIKKSITYIPNTVEETTEFTRLLITEKYLAEELGANAGRTLRMFDCRKNMEELIGQISEAKTREEAMKRIMTFVPCIMHCESRVGIKLLTMILIEGLSNYQGAKFPEVSEMRSKVEREATYISKVENIVSTQILGAFGSEAQWSMPVEKQSNSEEGTRKVGTINMENYKVRKIVDNLDKLIDISIVDDERKLRIKKCVKHYQELMCIMRKKEGNYTEEELACFQDHALEFFQLWVILYSWHGVTNYIHMIGVGHMLEYMQKYGNLNKYSQQGWEALNALIKLFFFCRTNKGRKNSGDGMTNLKSKLVPLGRLVQRRMLWVANLVPKELWDDDYNFQSSPNPFGDETGNEDIIFDSDAVQQESV